MRRHSQRSTGIEQLHTAEECRDLDRRAIAGGVPGIELMRRAGRAVFEEVLHGWPDVKRLSIACGKGNNAGDGYVIAQLGLEHGLHVQLIQIGDPASLAGDAALAREAAIESGLQVLRTEDGNVDPDGDLVVDALLGTGIKGAPRGAYGVLIERLNDCGLPIVAVDVPSGVLADTGAAPGSAVRAALTVTFIGRKIGLHTSNGATLAGRVKFVDLGVGSDVRTGVSGIDWLSFADVTARHPLPRRTPSAYKQALGHLLVVGGDSSMGGAPLMAAETALRAGAGMVTVVTRGAHRNAILSRRPEVMVVDAEDRELCAEVFDKARVLVVGPGLGRRAWGESLLEQAVGLSKPMVVDADGLFLLARSGAQPSASTIITPHTGEAATLLDIESRAVDDDRVGAARRLAERVQGIAVLKGAGSVVAARSASGSRCLGICAHGNPGMATAGMGDVLAGLIGGLLAQSIAAESAALIGTCLHSLAADQAALRTGEMSLLATDILPEVMTILRLAERRGHSA